MEPSVSLPTNCTAKSSGASPKCRHGARLPWLAYSRWHRKHSGSAFQYRPFGSNRASCRDRRRRKVLEADRRCSLHAIIDDAPVEQVFDRTGGEHWKVICLARPLSRMVRVLALRRRPSLSQRCRSPAVDLRLADAVRHLVTAVEWTYPHTPVMPAGSKGVT